MPTISTDGILPEAGLPGSEITQMSIGSILAHDGRFQMRSNLIVKPTYSRPYGRSFPFVFRYERFPQT